MLVDAPASDPLDSLKEALSDRYRFDRELGRGGMAIVYLAHDLRRDRSVAIKVLRPELTSSIGTARFLREIEIASRLVHPNLLPLHDSGESAGSLYFVMPYVDGETLRAYMKRHRQLPVDDALRITRDVTDAIAYAHKQGVLHRDIKPENILLQGDQALVADFGIARAVTASAPSERLTSSGVMVGTPIYMSPEQGLADHELDARSDLYSLACVVYEMLAGEPPFTGPNPQAIVARHAGERVPSLRVVRPNLTEDMEAVMQRALAKAPADRYQTAESFLAAFQTSATSVARRSALRRWVVSHPRLVATAVVALAAATVGATLLTRTPLAQNDWILVSDFDGVDGDARLAGVVRDLATHAFKQSRFVQVFDRRQLSDVMRRANVPETTHVTAARAREFAERGSVTAVLLGAVRSMDSSRFELVMHVVRANTGATLASAIGTATEADLPTAVQTLVQELRGRLGERKGAIAATRPLRDVATPSFEAFRLYVSALDRFLQHGDVPGSNRLLHEAIARDSGFASAWAMLGQNYVTARQPDSARVAMTKAVSLPGRLSVAEGYRLKGDMAYALDHDLNAAVRWYDLYLAEAPQSSSGRSNRALYRSALGQYDKTLPDLRDAVALNPFGDDLVQPQLLNLGAILVVLGQYDEAERVAGRLTGMPADYLRVMLSTSRARWADAERASTLAAGVATTPSVFRLNALTSLASALAARGAADSADAVLRAAVGESRGSMARWYERARLEMALVSGQPVAPRADLVPKDTTPAGTMLRALWASVAGDTLAAADSLRALGNLSPRQAANVGAAPALASSWIDARAGRWQRVTDRLAPLALQGEHDPTFLDRPDGFILRWTVANAYEQLGKPDSARVFLELIRRPGSMPPGHFALRGFFVTVAEARLAQLKSPRR